MSTAELQRAIDSNPVWYHTIELAPGVTTPGWFDLRPIVDKLPWPDVQGKRCLDVGTYDGFLAFEMERRGAAEVVALDIPNHEDWDWPPDVRARGAGELARMAGPEKGVGFRVAKEALGSKVEKVDMSAYDLSPEALGTFDVVVCGSLMLHLRDPSRALEAMRTVCTGEFMSSEEVDLRLSFRYPRRSVARLNGSGPMLQWWVPNVACHRRWVYSAGFEIIEGTRPYSENFGVGHTSQSGASWPFVRATRTLLTGGSGVPHAAVRARPRL